MFSLVFLGEPQHGMAFFFFFLRAKRKGSPAGNDSINLLYIYSFNEYVLGGSYIRWYLVFVA